MKKGEKWAIINTELKAVTDFGFDDIVCDDWGFCSRNGVVFAKIGEKYYLINSEGVQIGDEYDAVSPFCHPVPRLLCRQENGDLSLQKEIRF
mgnify:CR=1 FL=1